MPSNCPLAQTPLLHIPNTSGYNGFVYCTCQHSSTTLASMFPLVCPPAVTQLEVEAMLRLCCEF